MPICETCETTLIRFVHIMQHPAYDGTLRVGCICAGNMERDAAGAAQREADFRKRHARRSNWLARTWRISSSGNEYLNADGFNVVIYRRGDHWAARV